MSGEELKTLLLQQSRSKFDVMTQQIDIVVEHGHQLCLQWTPSQCGISGNEHADSLATAAHLIGRVEPLPLHHQT